MPTNKDQLFSLLTYTGKWQTTEIGHLLKRTMFGAKKKDVDFFEKKSLKETVTILLNPTENLITPPVNDYDQIGLYNIPFGTTWINKPYSNPEDDGQRIGSFGKWSIGKFIHQDRSLTEKMILFWHNHFATQINSSRSNVIWNHFDLLRKNALGNFKELVFKITTDPHMLHFLNGEENTKLAPNENYARELQELFCLGKGPYANFTETDIKEAAKVLTGWKIDIEKSETYFKDSDHDTTTKTFSGFYNNAKIIGKTGADAGKLELQELLNIIFKNSETAFFICRKIYRWFVNSDITELIETKVIKPLAKIFKQNNFEIKPVLLALFTSEHFFDPSNFGVQIKSPLDFCIGLQREFIVEYAPKESYVVNYSMWLYIIENCNEMGQSFAMPPNVAGWPAYYQAPSFYELWINASTYPKRNEFSKIMIDYGYNREGHFFAVDVIAFAKQFNNPQDPDALINDSIDLLYQVNIDPESKIQLKKITLLSGLLQNHYWTDAWNSYEKNPTNEILKNTVESRLKNLYRFIVNSPEYQLM